MPGDRDSTPSPGNLTKVSSGGESMNVLAVVFEAVRGALNQLFLYGHPGRD